MYLYDKDGNKVKYNHTIIHKKPIEDYESKNGKPYRGCSVWIFIILGVVAVCIATWMIFSIIQDKK